MCQNPYSEEIKNPGSLRMIRIPGLFTGRERPARRVKDAATNILNVSSAKFGAAFMNNSE
jgi:hypothetical protein